MQGWDFGRQPDLLPEHEDDDPGPVSGKERDNVEGDFCVMILVQMMKKGMPSPSSSRSVLVKSRKKKITMLCKELVKKRTNRKPKFTRAMGT